MENKVKKFGEGWFICPSCGKKQTAVNRWETASVCYEYDFETQNWEMKDIEDGDFEDWTCPECRAILVLPEKLLEQIY
jgi:predicted RNA-binding Zn-ribbon protein involved in translation (DUF1610 family)